MFVASATSTRVFLVEGLVQTGLGVRHLVGRNPRRQFQQLVKVRSAKARHRLADALPRRRTASTRSPDLVLDDAACAAELAQRVEIAEHGHVRVGRVHRVRPVAAAASSSHMLLRGGSQRRRRTQKHDLRAAALAPPDPR